MRGSAFGVIPVALLAFLSACGNCAATCPHGPGAFEKEIVGSDLDLANASVAVCHEEDCGVGGLGMFQYGAFVTAGAALPDLANVGARCSENDVCMHVMFDVVLFEDLVAGDAWRFLVVDARGIVRIDETRTAHDVTLDVCGQECHRVAIDF